MKLTALKRFHASDIRGPEGRRTVDPGEDFDAPDETGKQLLERKLAVEAGQQAPAEPEEKSEPELLNKAEPAPKRKRKSAVEEETTEE